MANNPHIFLLVNQKGGIYGSGYFLNRLFAEIEAYELNFIMTEEDDEWHVEEWSHSEDEDNIREGLAVIEGDIDG